MNKLSSRALMMLALLAPAFLLQSCFISRLSANGPIDPQSVRTLQPGRTTAKECVELLGAPADVVQLGKRSAYAYRHTLEKNAGFWLVVIAFFNEDARQDRVWLFFDENNVLSHVGSTFASHRTQYSMPWEDIHEESDSKSRDAERKGLEPKK